MVNHNYCAHGTCKSNGRKSPELRWATFPKKSVDENRARRWVELEFLTVELPYLWVIAQIFRQIRVHSSIIVLFVLFEDFLLKKILKV